MTLNRTFGSWGNVVFEGALAPVYDSFSKTNSWKYARNNTLSGLTTLQPLGRELKTVTFSVYLQNFVFYVPTLRLTTKLIGLTGIPDFGQVDREETYQFYDDADAVIDFIYSQANEQAPHPLYEGEKYLGRYVLLSMPERKEHYRNGETKRETIDLTFLEWVGEV